MIKNSMLLDKGIHLKMSRINSKGRKIIQVHYGKYFLIIKRRARKPLRTSRKTNTQLMNQVKKNTMIKDIRTHIQ